MFKWLKKISKKKIEEPVRIDIPESEVKIVEREDLLNLTIIVNPDSTIDIEFDVSDFSAEMGLVLGEILHKMSSGKFNKYIDKILDSYVTDKEKLQFVIATKTYWKTLNEEDNKSEDDPVISPLQVFAQGDLPNA